MRAHTLCVMSAAIGLGFCAPSLANTMTKAEHKSARTAIEVEHKAARKDCEQLKGTTKDVCEAEAKGRERVAMAELEAKNQPTRKARYEVSLAKANAEFTVARKRCDEKAGNAKDVCMKAAHAAENAAKADAELQMNKARYGKN